MTQWLKGLVIVTFAISSQLSSMHVSAEQNSEQVAKPADWYLHMNVKAMQKSLLGEKFYEKKSEGLAIFKAVFGDELLNKANFVALQGNANDDESKILLIQGDFAQSKPVLIDKWHEIGLDSKIEYQGKTIYHGKLEKLANQLNQLQSDLQKDLSEKDKKAIHIHTQEKSNTVIYSAFKSEDVLVFSDNLTKLQHWLSEEKQWVPTQQSSVFQVVVDVKKSLLHGGVNLDEMSENFQFESISAQQISQVSASYTEEAGYIELQVGIETTDTETALRIKSVANGLIALKILSDSNRAVINLLSNIQFEQDAGNLLVKLSGPTESFKTLLQQKDLM